MRFPIIAGAAALALAWAAAPALAITLTPELQKVIDAAKQEGALTVAMADEPLGGAIGIAAGAAGMNKMFHTNIAVRYVPAPPYAEQGAQLLTEMQAKQPSATDIYVSTAVQYTPLWKAGLFRSVDFAKLYPERLKPEFVEGGNGAVRVYTSIPSVLYNKRYEKDVDKTNWLADYLKPEWKGKFVTTPYLAGFDVLISKDLWGPEKATQYVEALSQQVSGLLSCGAPDRIASGEMPVLVVDCAGAVENLPKFHSVLGAKVLRDTAQRRYGYLSIPVNMRVRGRAWHHLRPAGRPHRGGETALEAGMVFVMHPNQYLTETGSLMCGEPVVITPEGAVALSAAPAELDAIAV